MRSLTSTQAHRWQPGGHTPPDDIGSNFYPVLGPYDARDDNGAVAPRMPWIRPAGVTASGYGQNYVPANAVDGQLSELGIYAS
jgi:hypothetical protein